MKKTELELIFSQICEQIQNYERTLVGFIVAGVHFCMEPEHAHIKAFCENSFFTMTSLIGFYQLDENDFEWLKERLLQQNFYFRQTKDMASFIKYYNH